MTRTVATPVHQPDASVAVVDLDSPLGVIRVSATADGVSRIRLGDDHTAAGLVEQSDESAANATAISFAQRAADELAAYFADSDAPFTTPLAPRGTQFQMRIWSRMREIPRGETMSYGELAREVGSPNASRAVGMACGRNPIPIIVPCHRVVAANGSLHGFSAGLWRKEWLLEHECGIGLFSGGVRSSP